MSRGLPNDLLFRTLQRLPVKSLIRFKCVNKTWGALIEDPEFVEAHLDFSRSNHKAYFVQHSPMNMTYICDPEFAKFERIECSEFIPSRVSIFLGCFDGVVLLGFGRILVLWNPSIRKFVMAKYPGESAMPETLAFGVNSINKEHEVAGIFKSGSKLEAQAYSLSQQEWRKLETGAALPRFSRVYNENAFLDGTLHCIAQKGYTSSQSVLSLDLGNEVLKETTFPEIENAEDTVGEPLKKILAEFRGLLSLFVFFGENGDALYYSIHSCDVWVMKESWIKFQSVELTEPDASIYKSVSLGWNSQILMLSAMSFVTFDIENGSFKRFELEGCGIVCPYTESLLLSKEGVDISECEDVLCRIWNVDRAEYGAIVGWVRQPTR